MFLKAPTPDAWVSYALGDLTTLLVDHANCEYKAAATGMSLITKYKYLPRLQRLMARLVREEMLHYEQVLVFMDRMGIEFRSLSASRYVRMLRESVRKNEDDRLVDLLIVCAIVEARSCERFAALWPHLPTPLGRYYKSLLRSEDVITKIIWHLRKKIAIKKALMLGLSTFSGLMKVNCESRSRISVPSGVLA